jgi:hypothetical protein
MADRLSTVSRNGFPGAVIPGQTIAGNPLTLLGAELDTPTINGNTTMNGSLNLVGTPPPEITINGVPVGGGSISSQLTQGAGVILTTNPGPPETVTIAANIPAIQSPWLQNVNGGGFALINVGTINSTGNIVANGNVTANEVGTNSINIEGVPFASPSVPPGQVVLSNVTGIAAPPNQSVQWNNNGVFGGSANLTWDNVNSRLGINTTTPQQALDVSGGIRSTGFYGNTNFGLEMWYGTSGTTFGNASQFQSDGGFSAVTIEGSPVAINGNMQGSIGNDASVWLGARPSQAGPPMTIDTTGSFHVMIGPPAFRSQSLLHISGVASAGNLFLGELDFANYSISAVDKRIASISCITGAALDSGVLSFQTAAAGVLAERMRIDSAGNITFNNLPSSDPGVPGQLWRSGNQVMISV